MESGAISVTTIAVAIYIGAALFKFFDTITRDLVTPVVAGLFPGASQSLDKITISIGPIKLNIGEVIGATLNLMVAYVVVSVSLPYIKAYAPIGGRR
jgi:large-conductance mechanosensitive channel